MIWRRTSTHPSIGSLGGDCLKQPSWTGGFSRVSINRRASEPLGRLGVQILPSRRARGSQGLLCRDSWQDGPLTPPSSSCFVSNDTWDWTFSTIGTDLDSDKAYRFPVSSQLVRGAGCDRIQNSCSRIQSFEFSRESRERLVRVEPQGLGTS